jgi:hypothetical protein
MYFDELGDYQMINHVVEYERRAATQGQRAVA